MTQPIHDALSRAVTDYVSALRELGIEIAEPHGRVTIDPETGYTRIGFVVVWNDGGIVAVPCRGASPWQITEVCRHAEAALLDGPIGPQWTRIRDLDSWETSIYELTRDPS